MAPGKKKVDAEIYEKIADDALSLLRINLVLVGLYFSAFGLFYQAFDEPIIENIINARYTMFSFQAMIASLVVSILFYRKGRRVSVQGEVYKTAVVSEEIYSINSVTAAGIASAGSVICLILGILEGISGQTPNISSVLAAVALLILIWILLPMSVLVISDYLAGKSDTFGSIREMFL